MHTMCVMCIGARTVLSWHVHVYMKTLTCTGGNQKQLPAQLEITAKVHAKHYHSIEKRGASVMPSGLR
jgi:hypothetical protein